MLVVTRSFYTEAVLRSGLSLLMSYLPLSLPIAVAFFVSYCPLMVGCFFRVPVMQ